VSSTLRPASVDAVQIGQVVFNLVTNAVQAVAADSGSVVFRARENDDGMIVLDVADTGPGIPVDVATHMFEPLFTTKARGLGLGLTVSRMLAENNGGGLTFVSSPGQGTTFTLTMPVASG
jgi:signal transduction histidine kinase